MHEGSWLKFRRLAWLWTAAVVATTAGCERANPTPRAEPPAVVVADASAGHDVDAATTPTPDSAVPLREGGGDSAATVTETDGSSVDGGSRDAATSSPDSATGQLSDAGRADAAADAGRAEAPEAPPEPACASDAGMLSPGTTRETLEVGGVSRTYWLTVPSAYDGETPAPLVLDFHGLGLNGQSMRDSFSGFTELAERENLVVAWPDGIDSAWNVGACCTRERDIDDVAFARAIVERVSSLGCLDRTRVYATGYSNGGGMSFKLACEASDLFAAVAPGAFDLIEEMDCTPARPITVIAFRGANDPIVYAEPHESSPPTWLIGGYTLPPIHFLGPKGTFERWADLNGCSGEPRTDGDGCRTHDACGEGVEVTLCLDDGGGHDAPDAQRAWQTLRRFRRW